MTTILPGPLTRPALVPAPRPAPPARPTSRVPAVLAAVGLVHVAAAMCLNWVWVYVRFFSVAPDLNPVTIGIHRVLLLAGLGCVAIMAAVGARRGGWSAFSAGAAFAGFGLVAAVVRVEGAIPGL